MKRRFIIVIILVSLTIGAVTFFIGFKTGQSSRPRFQPGQMANRRSPIGGQAGINESGLGFNLPRPLIGEIIALDDQTLTLKTPDGSNRMIIYSPNSTLISQSASASADDLVVGKTVTVTGQIGQGNSLTAQSITINP